MPRAGDRFLRRASRLVLIVLVAYGVLVASHEGEFYPFSIYPMFSQAGRTWTKVVVRDVSDTPVDPAGCHDPGRLPGQAVALADHGIWVDDVANFVERTPSWTPERISTLHHLLAPAAAGRSLAVYALQPDRSGSTLVYVTRLVALVGENEAVAQASGPCELHRLR